MSGPSENRIAHIYRDQAYKLFIQEMDLRRSESLSARFITSLDGEGGPQLVIRFLEAARNGHLVHFLPRHSDTLKRDASYLHQRKHGPVTPDAETDMPRRQMIGTTLAILGGAAMGGGAMWGGTRVAKKAQNPEEHQDEWVLKWPLVVAGSGAVLALLGCNMDAFESTPENKLEEAMRNAANTLTREMDPMLEHPQVLDILAMNRSASPRHKL